MTFKELAISRITPKLRNGNNYKNLLRFMVDFLDRNKVDIDLIKDLKNLESDSDIVLDELGKLLGFFPRPQLPTGVTGAGFFQYDVNGYNLFPYAGEGNQNIRPLTNEEYSRLLRAATVLTTFNGVIDDWVKLFTVVSGGEAYIINKRSSYDIIIKKDLSDFDKSLIEFLTKDLDNLTVSKDFLGTAPSGQPFQYGVAGYNTSPYITTW